MWKNTTRGNTMSMSTIAKRIQTIAVELTNTHVVTMEYADLQEELRQLATMLATHVEQVDEDVKQRCAKIIIHARIGRECVAHNDFSEGVQKQALSETLQRIEQEAISVYNEGFELPSTTRKE
jgi:hypothetical protein